MAGAAATAARAATTSRRNEDGAPWAPRLTSVATGLLVVGPTRIVVAVVLVAAARLAGLGGSAAFLSFAAGALGFGAFYAASRGRSRPVEPVPVPLRFSHAPWWVAGVRASLPSTAGLTVLGAVALSFSTALAAVIGGMLAAMGVLALVTGVQLALEERRTGTRLWVGPGLTGTRYAG